MALDSSPNSEDREKSTSLTPERTKKPRGTARFIRNGYLPLRRTRGSSHQPLQGWRGGLHPSSAARLLDTRTRDFHHRSLRQGARRSRTRATQRVIRQRLPVTFLIAASERSWQIAQRALCEKNFVNRLAYVE